MPVVPLCSLLGACILSLDFAEHSPENRSLESGSQSSGAPLRLPFKAWIGKITMKRHSPRPNTVTLRRSREGQERNGYWKATWRAGLWLGLPSPLPAGHLTPGGREADAGRVQGKGLFPHRPKCCLSKGFGLLGGGGIQSLKLGRYNGLKSCFNKAQGWVWSCSLTTKGWHHRLSADQQDSALWGWDGS